MDPKQRDAQRSEPRSAGGKRVKPTAQGAEDQRLAEDSRREKYWKRFGPYLADRQWGTVREDYSARGLSWESFPHDHARSRAYRWGEDGLLGICDRKARLCFALALWNGQDPILKERLFGLSGPEGNHGEDVKEAYFYLDSTPTHSFMKALYKYPLAAYPYARLVDENRRRSRDEAEFELADSGVFEESRYVDVFAEYCKASPEDVLIQITVANRGSVAATVHVLPTLWFRNTWSWGRHGDEYPPKPSLRRTSAGRVAVEHAQLGSYAWLADAIDDGGTPELLFTENETNTQRLFGSPNASPFVKDAFHEYVIAGRREAVNPAGVGTKCAALYRLELPAGGEKTLKLRLVETRAVAPDSFGDGFDQIFEQRRLEADAFYASKLPKRANEDERLVMRQGYAGLLWTKQFYHFVVKDWLEGDPAQPTPPDDRWRGRNVEWLHSYHRDVISMPDKWEYPWFAAWDLAFHMIPFADIDPEFAKQQLLLFLREWYMHPNGQIPAYEFAFGDVNPPVHAWAAWRIYKMTGPRRGRDRAFLERVFHKLLLNFTWWVNRKDIQGRNLFSGGFLGLDNIGVFDRSQPLPTGGYLQQADGTAWMAFYAATMLSMALELASEDGVYEDVASKFFEHFVTIADAMNTLGGSGLWDEQDGFYYDHLDVNGDSVPLRVRSLVGLAPLFAVEILEDSVIDRLPGFKGRMEWLLRNRADLGSHISYCNQGLKNGHGHRLLAIPSRERLERVLRYMLDESEFLSQGGIRSVSRFHARNPYVFDSNGQRWNVDYVPAESTSGDFGGNSNWRGPVWFPMNYLLVEALERYHHFFGDDFTAEFPTGSGRRLNLKQIAQELAARLSGIFLRDARGQRPCHGADERFRADPHWRNLVLFHEYFCGDTAHGLGASHQTGWTALAVRLIADGARNRRGSGLNAIRAIP